jgi:hypothetical protein
MSLMIGAVLFGASACYEPSEEIEEEPEKQTPPELEQYGAAVEVALGSVSSCRAYMDVGLTLEDVKINFDYFEVFCTGTAAEGIYYGKNLSGQNRLVISLVPGTYNITVLGGTAANGNLATGEKVLLATGRAENQFIEAGKINVVSIGMSPLAIEMEVFGVTKISGSTIALAQAKIAAAETARNHADAFKQAADAASIAGGASGARIPARETFRAAKEAAHAAIEAALAVKEDLRLAREIAVTAESSVNAGSITAVNNAITALNAAVDDPATGARMVITAANTGIASVTDTTTLAQARSFAAQGAAFAAQAFAAADTVRSIITTDIGVPIPLPIQGQKGEIRYVRFKKGKALWLDQALIVSVRIQNLANLRTLPGGSAGFTDSESMIRSLSMQEFAMPAIRLEAPPLNTIPVGEAADGVLRINYTAHDDPGHEFASILDKDCAGRFYFNLTLPIFGGDSKLAQWNIRNRILWNSTGDYYYGGGIVFLFGNASFTWVAIETQ